jgi:hypothetical protein
VSETDQRQARAGSSGGGSEAVPGQGWAGKLLLAASVAGIPLVFFVLRRSGRWGGLMVEAGCGALFARDLTMTATGAPAKLRPLPRLLLLVEVITSGTATVAGSWAWVWRPFAGSAAGQQGPGTRADQRRAQAGRRGQTVIRVATVAAAVTFALHTAREAIYLSPDHGRR